MKSDLQYIKDKYNSSIYNENSTILEWCYDMGQTKYLHILVENGADIYKKNIDGQTIFHVISTPEDIDYFLQKADKSILLNLLDNKGRNFLCLKDDVCTLTIKKYFNDGEFAHLLNHIDNEGNNCFFTNLGLAVTHKIEYIDMLLRYCKNINYVNKENKCLLNTCTTVHEVNVFIKHGADIHFNLMHDDTEKGDTNNLLIHFYKNFSLGPQYKINTDMHMNSIKYIIDLDLDVDLPVVIFGKKTTFTEYMKEENEELYNYILNKEIKSLSKSSKKIN